MRMAVVTIFATAAALSQAAGPAKHRVDLDRRGALENLERQNPAHFQRVKGILDLANDMPCQMDEFAKVSRAKFDADEAKCGVLLQTSDPAKRRLSFVLDDTNYFAVVTMKQGEKVVPVK